MSESIIREWVEAHRWAVLLALLGAALIGSGVFWWRSGGSEPVQPEIITNATDSAKLVIDVSGEVAKPGVYQLPAGSRVEDALQMAGGETENADTEYIEKYLNRAAKLSDGQKLYVPRKNGESNQNSASSVQDNRININSASQAELEALPGIGPVTAGKIVAGRPYQNISELVERKIVGQKVYDQIKDQVSIW